MTTSQTDVADELRAWAQGVYPLAASVELLVRRTGGRFPGRATHGSSTRRGCAAHPSRYRADLAEIPDHIGSLTCTEQSFLLMVASNGIDTPNQTR